MKVSLNFLKNYIDINISPEKLAELLTLHTAEVEKIEKIAGQYKNVFVGRILDIKKHPNARDLFIARADLGIKEIQIIFGKIFPVEKGELLPIAIAPALLPTGIKIKRVNLRGFWSDGMITSDEELGLPFTNEGLVRFKKGTKPGTPLCRALGLEDIVFDVDILPNRASDLLSHLGIAREIAALTKRKIKNPQIKIKEDKNKKTNSLIKVLVQDRSLCPRYIARVVDNVAVKESPLWLKSLLIAAGIRPINNIVDITNYVMLELGQPLHVFDYKKIEGKRGKKTILVRLSRRGESIYTLDGKKRKLAPENLLIADKKKGIAVAGVMGGRNSEVTGTTKMVVLEAASFNSINIRRTSRALDLKTEASIRFEKSIDPNLSEKAIDRAAFLIQEIAGGKVLSGRVDYYPRKIAPKTLSLKVSSLNDFLGVSIKEKEVIEILTALSFEVKRGRGDSLNIKVPTFRLDINIPEELIEEVARVYGYDRIKPVAPKATLTAEMPNESLNSRRQIKTVLKDLSFTEVYNYSFQNSVFIEKFGLKKNGHLEILNPLDKEMRFLRTSLFPGLFLNLKRNLKNFDTFRIFEIGKVYLSKGLDKLPTEKHILSGLFVGERESFYTAKGVLEVLLGEVGVILDNKNIRPIEKGLKESYFGQDIWHPGKTAEIILGRKKAGVFGAFHPKLLNKIGIKEPVFGFSLDLELVLEEEKVQTLFEPIPKYPEVRRDLAIAVKKNVLVEEVCNVIQRAGGEAIEDIDLFDIYESEKIGFNRKSLAFHIIFRSSAGTLSDKEVSDIENKIEKALKDALGAEIRIK